MALKVGLHQDLILLNQSSTLKCSGDHKVVDFWSKGHIMIFQTFDRDTPFLRRSIHVEAKHIQKHYL